MSILLLAIATALAEPTTIIDRVVAVVEGQPGEGQPILASDLHLQQHLAGVDPAPVPFWTSGRTPEQIAIDAAIVRATAADISVYQPSHDALVARVEALRDAFGPRWAEFLQQHGLDEARLELEMRRRMVVERFLMRNLQSDPADLDSWLAESSAMLDKLRQAFRVRLVPDTPRPTP